MSNESPAPPAAPPQHSVVLPGQSPDGTPILAVLLKRSYRLVPQEPAERLPHARPLVPGDRHFGDPMNSTVAHESDHVPYKPATDFVVHAEACTPGGRSVEEMLVSVVVGGARKDLVVTGDRVARHRSGDLAAFSDPVPFTRMPMRYERAYGGVDVRSDPSLAFPYARNHLGCGFVVRDTAAAIEGLALPNIESPQDRLSPERLCCGHVMHWENQPIPDGIGWFSKYWQPRAGLAGVMPGDRALEAQLRHAYTNAVPAQQRADYAKTSLPNMNFSFFNGASRGLVRPFLAPGERIAFRNLHPSGDVIGALPTDAPVISLDLGRGIAEHTDGVLQTVLVRLAELEVDLVWRAAFRYPGLDYLPRLRRMHVEISEG